MKNNSCLFTQNTGKCTFILEGNDEGDGTAAPLLFIPILHLFFLKADPNLRPQTHSISFASPPPYHYFMLGTDLRILY
jgi:hypothetical protein